VRDKAVRILDQNRVMAIATIRPDGWPQTTFVGYANQDIFIYFIVSRQSQKFANMMRDDRISLAVGQDFHKPTSILAISAAAHASEVSDAKQRGELVQLIRTRHPGLKMLASPDFSDAAVIRAHPSILTISDYSKGFGHADVLTVAPGGLTEMTAARPDVWGYGSITKTVS
jgi:hypothetical protein